MKKRLEFSAGFVGISFVCAALLASTGCATKGHVEGDAGVSAKVVRLKGGARYATGSRAGDLLKVGDTIKPGVVLQTADQSELELVLGGDPRSHAPGAEQDIVRMSANSLLGIDTLMRTQTGADVVEETQLDLKGGRIYGVVKKAGGASRFEVSLPNGVAGTHGAEYDMTAEGVVKVLSGSVVLAYVRPDRTVATQIIAQSQQCDARTGALSPLPESGKTSLAGSP